MEKLTFDMIKDFALVVLALLTLYRLIIGAKKDRRDEDSLRDAPIRALREEMETMKNSFQEQLDNHMELLKRDNTRLIKLEESSTSLGESLVMALKGIMVLVRYSIDGNNTEGLKAYNSELQEYLVEKK